MWAGDERSVSHWRRYLSSFAGRFQDVNPRDPVSWPVSWQLLLGMGVVVLITVAVHLTFLRDINAAWRAAQAKETALRAIYTSKLEKSARLQALQRQRDQVQAHVQALEKLLPSRSEMSVLLSEINRLGLERGLQFELFKPGAEVVGSGYAELAISFKVSGGFHAMGMFVSDIARFPRIVTLDLLQMAPAGSAGGVTLDAVLRTYRYLDSSESIQGRRDGAP